MSSVLTEDEKEERIKELLPSVKFAAYRLSWKLPPHLTTKDLVSVGLMGLMDAFDKFVEGRAKFKTYAELRIRGAMLDELRAASWIPRLMMKKMRSINDTRERLKMELDRAPDDDEIANELKMPLKEYYKIIQCMDCAVLISIEALSSATPVNNDRNILDCIADPRAENSFNLIEDREMRDGVASLIDALPQKEKIIMSLYYWEELTMKEVGICLNITESRVSQIHTGALVQLKTEIKRLNGKTGIDIPNKKNNGNGKKQII